MLFFSNAMIIANSIHQTGPGLKNQLIKLNNKKAFTNSCLLDLDELTLLWKTTSGLHMVAIPQLMLVSIQALRWCWSKSAAEGDVDGGARHLMHQRIRNQTGSSDTEPSQSNQTQRQTGHIHGYVCVETHMGKHFSTQPFHFLFADIFPPVWFFSIMEDKCKTDDCSVWIVHCPMCALCLCSYKKDSGLE